ncbi:hypothetical protein [Spiroplasma endosymbiont of Danaus chrysippus]|uniref:hypothetical protein n=1 Tax=Spiroplasma endosymbiont of Danaus chrysippus TaxID=2691041 RepID=UPI00157B0F28|nr:hypothetical protein [Spiroplasma endosymbiont of Danaus chrysippus]
MPFFNGFMSAFFASNLSSIIGNNDNNWFIPLNVFSNSSEFALGKMLGSHVSTTAMTMKLSDRVSVYPWDAKTGKKLEVKEQISTVDLSQKKTKEIFNHIIDDKVYIMAEDTEFLDIASPLTNEDTECQWNPTSNGVIDGSNYAYIIDTIVTQSLHQGEERHTFYSDNPFTYQGDYNEISVAQFRYNNMGYLTGNAFNWTTLYKLNHDEYEESEETTFSYPSKILPPSPQNIAKSIIINPDLKVELNYKDIPLTDTSSIPVKDNLDNWWNANSNKLVNYEIDLNSLLDPTLLIKSFNDLKRYYKSITIYYDYDIETVQEIHNNFIKGFGLKDWYTDFSVKEKFANPKKHDGLQEILLKDLIFQDNEPNNNFRLGYWNHNPNKNQLVHLESESGIANIYGITNKHYDFNSYKFEIKDNGNIDGWDNSFENNNFLNYCILNKKLKWNFYLQATLGKIENMWYINEKIGEDNKAYARIYINSIKANIYKIVLNSR